jgi:hypothetical protein
MAGPLILVKKQLYFLGFWILGLHVALALLFQPCEDLQSYWRALFIYQLELHVNSELDNCNQIKSFDTDCGFIEG